jgi:uncharacterized membrane protein
MTRLAFSREIYCPVEEVFAYHTDLLRAPQHWTNVVACERLDGAGVPVPGARYGWRYRMYGMEFTGTAVVREVVPGARFSFDADGGLVGSVECAYTRLGAQRTRVDVVVEYAAPMGVVGRAVDRFLVEGRNAHDAERALDRLAARLEADAAARLDMQPASGADRPPGPAGFRLRDGR